MFILEGSKEVCVVFNGLAFKTRRSINLQHISLPFFFIVDYVNSAEIKASSRQSSASSRRHALRRMTVLTNKNEPVIVGSNLPINFAIWYRKVSCLSLFRDDDMSSVLLSDVNTIFVLLLDILDIERSVRKTPFNYFNPFPAVSSKLVQENR